MPFFPNDTFIHCLMCVILLYSVTFDDSDVTTLSSFSQSWPPASLKLANSTTATRISQLAPVSLNNNNVEVI